MRRLSLISVCLVMFALALSPVFAGGGSQGGSGTKQDVTIEFIQWWEEQVTPGVFRQLMDQFESENPGIKVRLNSGPYASTKEQLIAGAATKTMPDVVGLDGAWVNDFASRGVISNLTSVMKQYNYNDGELGAQIKVNNNTYMIPVVNFAYPMFINNDILGNTPMPTNRSEFLRIAKAITNPSKNTYGWALPISLETPNGIQNDVMSWLWASGKTMMKNGRPDLTNTDVKSTVQFIKDMYDAGVIAPGAFAMKEIEKIEQFRNGRIGMAIGTLAWVNMVREAAPNLKFSVIPIPPADNFTGKQGMLYASWGIGIAENSKHKEEAWKLIAFLMREDINSKLSTHSNSFPGNLKSVPDYVKTDEVFRTVFELYQKSYLVNEFTGLPVAENLMRVFDEQLQLTLEGKQSIDTMLEKVQADWDKEFK